MEDLPLPGTPWKRELGETVEMLEKMLTEGILWLGYGIAILSVLKIILHTINGYRSESHMGTRIVASPSLLRRTDWNGQSETSPLRGKPTMVQPLTKSPSFSPLSSM
jgi:hypothetical protein